MSGHLKPLVLVCLVLICGPAQANGSGGINVPEHRDKPTLILISIDGFRWDFQGLYDTPTLDRIAADGVRAERMIPVFPTLTFPNHYSIATGLYPANHRLIGNRFPSKDRERFYALSDREAVQDGSWYGGQPVWVAAEKAGMVTAAYFFVGTEADVNGVPMTYWNAYDESVSGESRVDQVLDWLSMPEDRRPHFITLYFEDVDTTTHRFGPGSEQSLAAIGRVDGYLGRLLDGIEALPVAGEVYLVIVSDHGHIAFIENEMPFIVSSVVDIDGLQIVDHGASTYLYLPEPDPKRAVAIRDRINDAWPNGTAMLADETPEAWRVSSAAGFADVILVADPGYAALARPVEQMGLKSSHGWAPEAEGMHGYFLASGPRLPKGQTIGSINVVDVYPLMMEILGLPVTGPIDGDPNRLGRLLRQ
jgi:predicted AlkP superfamily pyrophosphatase or phosphodiesterase